jgi:hypothetical protein
MGKTSMFMKEDTGARAPQWTYKNPDNKAPDALGGDDLAWAMANQMAKKFTEHGIATGKSDAWYYYRVRSGLDRTDIRRSYSANPRRFRDGSDKQIGLPEFGRNMVNYFFRNSGWQFESNADAVTGMLCDPVTLEEVCERLQGVYANRRVKSRRD